MRILALGTYPIIRPIHGGQRRVAAIRDGYAQHTIPYKYLAVFDAGGYPEPDRGKDDILLGPIDPRYDPMWQIGDVRCGLFTSRNDVAFQRIYEAARRFGPSHLQLEQPFMYPVFLRLKERIPFNELKLIYSAQNVDSRLKRDLLTEMKLPEPFVDEIGTLVEDWERSACAVAEIVIAVSEDDSAQFQRWGATQVVVARNGVGHFPAGPLPVDAAQKLGSQRYFITIGSDHPPNVSGFLELLSRPDIDYSGAHPTIVICGGMVKGLSRHPEFQKARNKGDRRFVVAPDPIDKVLGALKNASHGFLLPILSGGGTNLKTAEALVSGRHVIGTRLAFRGFEEFLDAPGVHLADDAQSFRAAIIDVLGAPPLELSDEEMKLRQQVRWVNTLRPFFDRITGTPDGAAGQPASSPNNDAIGVRVYSNVAPLSVRGGAGAGSLGLELNPLYDEQAMHVIRRVLHRDSNAIDVGCHKGDLLRPMLQSAPRGTHYAFEPLPNMFAGLRRAYGHLPNVRLYELALSDTAGISSFQQVVTNPGYSGLRKRRYDRLDEQLQEITVKTDTLDNVISPSVRIDLIKVDVEGAELLVFRGGLETIRRNRPVIIFEHGIGAADSYDTGPDDVHELLTTKCGLRVNLMAEWLFNEGVPCLSRQEFADEFWSARNYYFIAYP